MGRRNNVESESFNRLKREGFEFEAPEDEYSEQPASSSHIGGVEGRQEFGIEGGVADEEQTDPPISPRDNAEGRDLSSEDPQPYGVVDPGYAGLSEWSASQGGAVDETLSHSRPSSEFDRDDQEIVNDIRNKLVTHKDVDTSHVQLAVTKGRVILQGEVSSEANRVRLDEVCQAIPGVKDVDNRLQVHP